MHRLHCPIRVGFKIEQLFEDPLVLVSTVDRGVVDWDPDFLEIDWDESDRSQVENLYHRDDKSPFLSVTMGWLGLRLITKFGGSTWVPHRLFKKHNLQRRLYLVRGAPTITRIAHMIYSEEAIKQRLPKLSPDDLRVFILRNSDLPRRNRRVSRAKR